jgi:hypothetical protein
MSASAGCGHNAEKVRCLTRGNTPAAFLFSLNNLPHPVLRNPYHIRDRPERRTRLPRLRNRPVTIDPARNILAALPGIWTKSLTEDVLAPKKACRGLGATRCLYNNDH